MSTEIELKLRLDAQTARQLRVHPRLAMVEPVRQRLLNTYYDTPSLDLHAHHIALRFRKKGWQWLLTVKTAEPASGGLAVRSEWEYPAVPGQFDFSPVDAPALRAHLESIKNTLLPVFTTDFQRTRWVVSTATARIELALDQGKVASQGREQPIRELELELLAGNTDDLLTLARELQATLDLRPAVESKAERGYTLFLNAPPSPWRAKRVALKPGDAAVTAFRGIALASLEQIQRNTGAITPLADPEFIHQARVGLRRLRSALKLFAPCLPPAFVATYAPQWRALANQLGEARNLDVLRDETLPPIADAFPNAKQLTRLSRLAEQRARQARRRIQQALADPGHARLILDFVADLVALPATGGPTLKALAKKALTRHARKLHRLTQHYTELDDAGRHALRLAFKKLRYALDFLHPIYPSTVRKPYLKAVARLQADLGAVNDLVTAELLLDLLGSPSDFPLVRGWLRARHTGIAATLETPLAAWRDMTPPWAQPRTR